MKAYIIKIISLMAATVLTCFIVLGMILVLVQLFSIFTLNGKLAASLNSLKSFAIMISVILGLLSLVLSYINKRSGGKSTVE